MNIIVVGAGNVGYYICQTLSERGHSVTLIENSSNVCSDVDDSINVRVVYGNGVSASVLMEAAIEDCSYFLAMTSDDRTNILSCSLAKALGASTTIARVHDQTFTDHSIVNYQLHFGIDYLLNPEALCAVELAKLIRNPGRVAVENFARGKIEVQMVSVQGRSRFANQSLRDLRLDKRVRVGYIQRGEDVEVATAESILKENDSVTLVGPADVLLDLRSEFEGRKRDASVGITLFGGSETTIAMIRLLNNPRFRVRIIESDAKLCREMAERFPRVTVIHGSATSLRLMEEEHIGNADYFVACTKKDEDNIMTCLQASKLGTKHVQLVINKPDYEEILEEMRLTLGVESAVAPRIVTMNEILRITSQSAYVELASLCENKVKVIEVKIEPGSEAAGKTLRDVALPPACVIAAVLHKFEATVPTADDRVLAGDRVVVIVDNEHIKDLLKILRS